MIHCNIDIETYSSVDIKKGGLYRYVQAPDFQIMLIAYSINGFPPSILDLTDPNTKNTQEFHDFVYVLNNPQVIKHAYNAAFEWYCLNKFFPSPIEQWNCTMVHGLYCGYPAGLSAVAAALGLPADKSKMGVGMSLIRTFCVPQKPTKTNGNRTRIMPHHEPEKWNLFKSYCLQDVVSEMAVLERLAAFPLPESEQKLWELDQMINVFGVAVDMDLISGALAISQAVTQELHDEAVRATGLANPKSVKQLMSWLDQETDDEVEITDLKKATVTQLIQTVDDKAVTRVLEIRQELSKTSVKKYDAMLSAVCEDGRVRGLLQFYGANRTGRWAGRLVQVQNLPRNYLETLDHARECVKAGKISALRFVYGSIPDTLSQLIRTAFVPSPGNVFQIADFSAIEARVIAWLAGEEWRQEVFRTHGKIYEASASQMFGIPIEKIKKGNPEYALRQKGKVAELALGYQGASGALITMGGLNMGLTEEELPDIVRRWRGANKRIVDLWYSVERAVITVLKTGQSVSINNLIFSREMDQQRGQDFLTIRLPSGRKLYYVRPVLLRSEKNREAIYYMGINQETKKWGEIQTYGGKLVENIIQAISRDCLAVSLLRLARAGYRVSFHIHDEVVIDRPFTADSRPFMAEDEAAAAADLETICRLMGEPIDWAPGLILRADGFSSSYYKKD